MVLLREITTAVGVDFVQRVRSAGDCRLPEVLGGGCAIFDADGDGLLDLYFIDTGDEPENGAANRLFLRGVDGRYTDATETSGLGDRGFGTGVAIGDIDNDGDADVYVGNWGEDALYRNDGTGRFENVTARAGIGGSHVTSSVAFLDYDLDGFLDIFVLHHVVPDAHRICRGRGREREFCSPRAYRHTPDTLYRNRGDGTFEDVSASAGIGAVAAAGLGVVVGDFNEDAWPDIYVANDQVANQLWINQKDGTFRNDAIALGVAYNGQAAPEASMGVTAADVNNDGRLDILCSHLLGETNTLYLSRGTSGFTDATDETAPGRPSFPYTGWGVALFDIEHDGDLDMAVVNGAVDRKAVTNVGVTAAFWREYAEPNQFLLNEGAPSFRRAAGVAEFTSPAEVSRGLAVGDLDGDGDLDVVITNITGPARIYENVAPKVGRWLRVRAVDPALRRDVYGAKIVLEGSDRPQCRSVSPASSFLSSSEPTVHFGIAPGVEVRRLAVRWPGGDWERYDVPGLDRELRVERGGGLR